MIAKFLQTSAGGILLGVLLVLAFSSNNLSKLIDAAFSSSRGPASIAEPTETPRNAIATEKYVDARIADLDAKSSQRHLEAMAVLNQQAVDLRKLSDRIYDLARTTRHAQKAVKELCPMEQYAVYRGNSVKKVSYCP